ncbi:hypothetical protein V490_01832 [Pseudogymnoascus sp. VKM F-3557]|nr:hypothetical protein V490_01832 [Pseudogymnoascus sp. VKM F-3557]
MSGQTPSMKAVLWEGIPYQVVVKDVPRPTIQTPTDVIVRVTTASICGSDLHNYHGLFGGSDVPYQMGHEAVGIVDKTGSSVQTFKKGDRVIIPCDYFIGAQAFVYGHGAYTQGGSTSPDLGGCQAEYVRVLNGDSNLISIPQGTENELDYLTCTDIFATAWTSITQTGDSVAIYGAGPVGLLAAYSAIFRGAIKVYSIDYVEARLARAESIGAIPIDLRKGDPSTQILKLQTNGVQRVSDCVGLECVNPQLKPQEGYILNDAIKLVAAGGGIAITGVYISGPKDKGEPLQGPQWATIPFDIASYWLKGPTINGGLVFASKAESALRDLVTAGRVQPGFVFDYVVHIDEAPEAYQLFSKHKVQKAAIKFTR